MFTIAPSTTARRRLRTTLLIAAVGIAALGVTACGQDDETTTSDTGATESGVSVSDPWVKAVDSGMTAAFGTLTNSSDEAISLVSASTDAAGMVELHEVVMTDGEMVMQPKEGGIPVPADGEATLEPGADHIMLMDVSEPIEPGDTVEIELTFSDGSTTTMEAVGKTFTGADEDYDSGSSMDDNSMGNG